MVPPVASPMVLGRLLASAARHDHEYGFGKDLVKRNFLILLISLALVWGGAGERFGFGVALAHESPEQEALGASSSSSSSGGVLWDKDCADFSSWHEAQDFYRASGPGDPHGLDRDRDGVACEALRHGATPLHSAAANSTAEVVELLLQHGADVHSKDDWEGATPLHWAAEYPTAEVVELLLQYGADVNAANNDGETPLHRAAEFSTAEVVELLLQHGADANATDSFGETPWDIAQQRGDEEIIRLYQTAYAEQVNKQELYNRLCTEFCEMPEEWVPENACQYDFPEYQTCVRERYRDFMALVHTVNQDRRFEEFVGILAEEMYNLIHECPIKAFIRYQRTPGMATSQKHACNESYTFLKNYYTDAADKCVGQLDGRLLFKENTNLLCRDLTLKSDYDNSGIAGISDGVRFCPASG